MSFGFITYGSYNLAAVAITGGWLPASCLAYRSGASTVEVDALNPLPVALATNPTITFASPQAVTQSGTWTVDVGNWPATQPVSGSVSVASLPSLAAGSATIGKVDQGAAGASAWPVSLASLPAFASAPTVLLGAGSAAIGSVTVTSAPTTAITAAALPLPSGAATDRATAAAPFAVRLSDGSAFLSSVPVSWASAQHVVIDSASAVAVTSLPNVTVGAALPAGTNVIGHVIVDTAPTTAVTNTNLDAALSTLAKESGGHLASIDTYAARIPAQGQALAAASMPVVLPSAQDVVAYAPAKEAGGNLATIAAASAHLTDGSQVARITPGNGPCVIASGSTMTEAGIIVKGSAGVAIAIHAYNNGSGSALYFMAFDQTTTSGLSGTSFPKGCTGATAANNGATPGYLNIGQSQYGVPCSSGIVIVPSTTNTLLTKLAAGTYNISYNVMYV